jgi:acetyl-CoA decarbonylase/synthase complex subunit delta
VWKSKEAGQTIEEAPTLGDAERRAILMEAVSAVCYLLSGSNVVILRHPESVRLTRSFIDLMINGGMASDVQEISKRLELQEADLISLSPEPALDFGEEKPPKEKPAKPKKKAAAKPAKEEKKAAASPEPKKKPKEGVKPKEVEAKIKAEEEVKAKAEEEAKAKTEAEAKAKAEAEAKEKAEEEAKKKAEEQAKKKAEAEDAAKAEAKEKEKEELQALRYKRVAEREKLEAERTALEGGEVPKTPAAQQKTMVEKLIESIDRTHRRI